MAVIIYHNPRCSKSRATLELLQQKGEKPEIIEYLNTPPSPGELQDILNMLGLTPRQILRTKEAKEAGLDDPSLNDDELIKAIAANPAVIERPIVIKNGQARLGRPPEKVLEIL